MPCRRWVRFPATTMDSSQGVMTAAPGDVILSYACPSPSNCIHMHTHIDTHNKIKNKICMVKILTFEWQCPNMVKYQKVGNRRQSMWIFLCIYSYIILIHIHTLCLTDSQASFSPIPVMNPCHHFSVHPHRHFYAWMR